VILHLLQSGRTPDEVDRMLNKASGLLGLSGLSNDMRDLRREAVAGHEGAREALEVFTYRIRITIGAYAAAMGGLDAVIFTGGIGENDAQTRAEALVGLEFLGVGLEPERNRSNVTDISAPASRVKVLVIPTDEEGVIAAAVRQVL
jgi:acetate kinase